jgi:hypothetical protein
MAAVLRKLPSQWNARDVARTGASYIGNLCRPRGPASLLLRGMLGRGEEADLIIASLEVLAEEFAALADASLAS